MKRLTFVVFPLLVALLAIPLAIGLRVRSSEVQHAHQVRVTGLADAASVARAEVVERNLSRAKALLHTYDLAVPTSRDLPALIRVLTGLAHSTGVAWVSGAPQVGGDTATTSGPDGTTETPITLAVTGSLPAIDAYLAALSQAPRLLTVSAVNLTWQSSLVEATISATAYSR